MNRILYARDMALEYPRHIIVGLDAKDGKLRLMAGRSCPDMM